MSRCPSSKCQFEADAECARALTYVTHSATVVHWQTYFRPDVPTDAHRNIYTVPLGPGGIGGSSASQLLGEPMPEAEDRHLLVSYVGADYVGVLEELRTMLWHIKVSPS